MLLSAVCWRLMAVWLLWVLLRALLPLLAVAGPAAASSLLLVVSAIDDG